MRMKPTDLSKIGNTIRAVAKSQAGRFFKVENNTTVRSAFVSVAITAEVFVALIDAGVSSDRILSNEIDPTEDVMAAMHKAGYLLDDVSPLVD